MYQPYPGGSQMPEASGPSVPPSIVNACRAMRAGMAASLIGVAVDLLDFGAVKSALEKETPKLAPTQLTSAEHQEIGLIIASGLIQAALWLWIAQSARAGKGRARVLSTVLFALFTVGQLTGFASTGGDLVRFYGVLVWLIGLVAIVFLWQRPSIEFLRSSLPRGGRG
jgi:hypothetical protein